MLLGFHLQVWSMLIVTLYTYYADYKAINYCTRQSIFTKENSVSCNWPVVIPAEFQYSETLQICIIIWVASYMLNGLPSLQIFPTNTTTPCIHTQGQKWNHEWQICGCTGLPGAVDVICAHLHRHKLPNTMKTRITTPPTTANAIVTSSGSPDVVGSKAEWN